MKLHPAILEATALTRAGKIGDATALLKSTLMPAASFRRPAVQTVSPVDDVKPMSPGALLQPRSAAVPPVGGNSGAPSAAAKFDELLHASDYGRLTYRLYVPSAATAGFPLVVMLHGCTQSPDDFARGTGMNALADEFGFVVAYPAQTRAANMSRCWNWFKPGDQKRGEGEPALIAGMTRDIIAKYGIDPGRVYIAGLSAGGAAAAVMGEAYPDLYAAVGVHSGLACGAASDMSSAMSAMRSGTTGLSRLPEPQDFVPTITFHGDADHTVNKINGDQVIARATARSGSPLRSRTIKGQGSGERAFTRIEGADHAGAVRIEHWTVHGGGHAWFGGDPKGTYTDPGGPDASREMVRFFLSQSRREASAPG